MANFFGYILLRGFLTEKLCQAVFEGFSFKAMFLTFNTLIWLNSVKVNTVYHTQKECILKLESVPENHYDSKVLCESMRV